MRRKMFNEGSTLWQPQDIGKLLWTNKYPNGSIEYLIRPETTVGCDVCAHASFAGCLILVTKAKEQTNAASYCCSDCITKHYRDTSIFDVLFWVTFWLNRCTDKKACYVRHLTADIK